jgi:exopolysaccharide production protein ExoQ
MAPTRLPAVLEPAVERWLSAGIFVALPTVGLVAGPSYAALVFGLAALLALGRWVAGHRQPTVDRSLAVLAGGFLVLCWASVVWSVVPSRSLHSAIQLTAILLGVVVAGAVWSQPDDLPPWFLPALLGACILGALAASLDMRLGEQVERLIAERPALASLTKYNRGLDYLALIVWPVAAYAWWRHRLWWLVALLAAVAFALGTGVSLAGRVAFAIGLAVLLAASALPRLVVAALAAGTVIWGAAVPLILHLLASHEALLARHLKPSGVDRLEIWSYMSDRVAERPLLGWGLSSATAVPIRAAERASFHMPHVQGVYPHNQWLQLWVELGVIGTAFGIAAVLLILTRVWRLPCVLRPFAVAAVAAAMAVASVNYELTTDSWWAALAATGALFMILGRRVAGEGAA